MSILPDNKLTLSTTALHVVEVEYGTDSIACDGPDAPMSIPCRIRIIQPGGVAARTRLTKLHTLGDFCDDPVTLMIPSDEWDQLTAANWRLVIPSLVHEHLRSLEHKDLDTVLNEYPERVRIVGGAWRVATCRVNGRKQVRVTDLKKRPGEPRDDAYLTIALRLLTGDWEGLWPQAGDGPDWEVGMSLAADYLRMRWLTGRLPARVMWDFDQKVYLRRPFALTCPDWTVTLSEQHRRDRTPQLPGTRSSKTKSPPRLREGKKAAAGFDAWHPRVQVRVTGITEPFQLPSPAKDLPIPVVRLILKEVDRHSGMQDIVIIQDDASGGEWCVRETLFSSSEQ